MTTKEIIALASAGFTVEQIAMLNRVDTNVHALDTGVMPIQAAPATIPSSHDQTPTLWTKEIPPVPAAQAPAPSPYHSPAPSTATGTDTGTDTGTAFQQLLARMDALAINQSQQPPQPTADEILAQIINPPSMTGGKE